MRLRRLAIHPAFVWLAGIAFGIVGQPNRLSADTVSTQPTTMPALTGLADIGPMLPDLTGKPTFPLLLPAGDRARVIIFTAVDCPIANRYAPVISDLATRYADRGISFLAVYADPAVTADAARAHHEAFAYHCPAVLDHEQRLMHALGATRTPEAFVIGPDGEHLYHGRIDDLFEAIGKQRYAATTHDLADALTAIAAGKPVPVAETRTVGCVIPSP